MAGTAKKDDPKLWDKVKTKVTEEGKGGKPGQWSARKAQLAVHDYKEEGGGYEGPRDPDNHLGQWTREDWGTRSGGESAETGERYLPKKAREALSTEEYARTSRKKREDTAKGRQFSAQPGDVAKKTAGTRRTGGAGGLAERSKAELMEMARQKGVAGRSRMDKAALVQALG